MNHNTSDDSERGSEGCPLKPISTFADLQVKAYENRLRERLIAKYSTRTPSEAKRLEKKIEKLVQIYAEGRILLQGDPSDRIRRDYRLKGKEQTREIDITDEQE
jgi:hypothetical protein